MKITIELDANTLAAILQLTGEKKKSPAVTHALTEYLNWRRLREFIQRVLAGQTDLSATNDDLEACDV